MEQEATRDNIWLFAAAVEHLGYRRNISTGRMIPLPPNADVSVATYRDRDTGRSICVWPVTTDDQAEELGTLADRHGFTFVQYGRPRPREDAQARADTARTPLQIDADQHAGRLRALATEAANNAAVAAARGDDKTAHMHHDDAQALSYGAACVEAQSRRRA